MPQFQTVDLTVEQAADLLGVSVGTVRRRLAARELRSVRTHDDGRTLVRVAPYEDWVPVDAAAGLLGQATSTVRAAAQRGELAGRRDEDGRWRVKLLSVLEDPRCDPRALALFTGGEPGPPAERPERIRPAARVTKDVFFRIDVDELELLERAKQRHGTYAAAIVHALRAAGQDDTLTGDELAELRLAVETNRSALERARAAHRNLSERAKGRLVDELYCPACERVVAIEEFDVLEIDGTGELFHRPHGHRHGSKLRGSTVAARRKSEPSTT